MSVRWRGEQEMREIMRRPRPAPPAAIRAIHWKGDSAYINGKVCTVRRIAVFSWEIRIDGKVQGCCLTRSEARQSAKDLARGVAPSTDKRMEGTKSC